MPITTATILPRHLGNKTRRHLEHRAAEVDCLEVAAQIQIIHLVALETTMPTTRLQVVDSLARRQNPLLVPEQVQGPDYSAAARIIRTLPRASEVRQRMLSAALLSARAMLSAKVPAARHSKPWSRRKEREQPPTTFRASARCNLTRTSHSR